MAVLAQDYKGSGRLECKLLYQDNQWEDKAAKVMPWQSPCLVQHANIVFLSAVEIPHAAIYLFIGNFYLQELQQNIATNANPINMEEVDTGIVCLVLKETITKYKKLRLQ